MNVKIHQIFYDESTRKGVDPGFIPLDNVANPRPDWREYWPIREFLRGNRLDDMAMYGFFSPKFHYKTELDATQVHAFVGANMASCDAVVFSPFYDLQSLFLNVFEQGEYFHPGLLGVSQAFCDEIGLGADLATLVNDSRNSVFSNFLVARPGFWRQWLEINERLFAIAENPAHALHSRLNAGAAYAHEDVAMKVFVMERTAPLLLALRTQFRCAAYDPFLMTRSNTPFAPFANEAVICAALKLAYAEHGCAAYRKSFDDIARHVRSAIGGGAE
jgi:hypothetical protein